jgi:hypothetical protein
MGLLNEPKEMPLNAVRPAPERVSAYGKRPDGSPKGAGYFGELAHPDNPSRVSTELTIGVEVGGKAMDIPLLVPTLTQQEIRAVLAGKESDAIVRKAVDHALSRMKQGKTPYAEPGEYYTLPKE